MEIRKAQSKDKKAISDLYFRLYPKHKGNRQFIPIKNFQAKNLLFVAEENGEAVGFIWGTFINYGISRYGYIDELFIKPRFRRKKIGTSLVKKVFTEFKKLKTWALFVSTDKGDKTAQFFYRKLGFKTCRGPWFYMELEKGL